MIRSDNTVDDSLCATMPISPLLFFLFHLFLPSFLPLPHRNLVPSPTTEEGGRKRRREEAFLLRHSSFLPCFLPLFSEEEKGRGEGGMEGLVAAVEWVNALSKVTGARKERWEG